MLPIVERRSHKWGDTIVFHIDGDCEARLLMLRPGTETSLHAHGARTELQLPLSGIEPPTIGPEAETIQLPGGRSGYLIPPGCIHQFASSVDVPGVVLSLTYGRTSTGKDRI